MKCFLKIFFCSLFVSAWYGCGGASGGGERAGDSAHVDTALRSDLARFVVRERGGDSLALCVYDLTADTLLYGYRDTLAVPTASCLKLLTGLTALRVLGADYAFRTTLEEVGTRRGDTLIGTLVVRGDYDPLLADSDVARVANRLAENGLRVVRGTVCLAFPDEEGLTYEAHWIPGDIQHSRVGLNDLPRGRRERRIVGALQAGGLRLPAVRTAWEPRAQKGRVVGEVRHTLHQVLFHIWNHSSNIRAEALLRTLAAAEGEGKPLREGGLRILRRELAYEMGQDTSRVTLHDGCGLCPENRLSARQLCALLRFGWQHRSLRRELLAHLPVSGLRGTLVKQMGQSAARGRVMGKTGTLTRQGGVKSRAGYCRGRDGHMLAYAIVCAPWPGADALRCHDRLCELLVGGKGGK